MSSTHHIKGRGAQHNTANKFSKHVYARVHEEGIDLADDEGEGKTTYIDVFPKSIVNPVVSPDVGMDFSLNPYQGCEHGCVYCYARNTHPYWGYSAGVEFEQKILVKQNAVNLLRAKLDNPKWKPRSIALSGNTDCYQPVERKLKITRSLLETFLEYQNPVGIITKNALIQRDIDVLKALSEKNLVKVAISITTLNEDLRRQMEPRTASIAQRLDTISQLSQNGIPVQVMMAPIIPGLNSHEIFPLVEACAKNGALQVGYTVVRLNGDIGEIFSRWIHQAMPDRAEKVLHQIAEAHGGKLTDSRFGMRMKGEGNFAVMIKRTMEIARTRFLSGREMPPYDFTRFRRPDKGQLSLFG